ncbi:Sec-independent protein translocase subunit TatA [Myceligenerans crystallogenes]|uniref:Sec-independent protein translocase protein TatA n=1 Tax=Myceligenerans crystallogenes TaxID=316335 RepID=A0ABN2N7F9_9MICO
MGALQPWHWIVLIAIILLLFGSTRLPGLAKSVGQSMKIFKKEISELRDDDKNKTEGATGDAAGGTGAGERGGSTIAEPYTPGGAPKGNDTPKA